MEFKLLSSAPENVTNCKYSKTCVKWPLSKRPNIGFQDQLSLNAGPKYCRMLQEHSAILSPSLNYNLSLSSLFSLFLNGHFTQVLLYSKCPKISNTFRFLFANKMLVIRAGSHKLLF